MVILGKLLWSIGELNVFVVLSTWSHLSIHTQNSAFKVLQMENGSMRYNRPPGRLGPENHALHQGPVCINVTGTITCK